MGHAHDDFIDALLAGAFDGQVQERNQAFRAFKRETFRADKFLADEFFEDHSVGKTRQDPKLFGAPASSRVSV